MQTRALLFACALIGVTALPAHETVKVTLRVFSGTQDPTWMLSPAQAEEFHANFSATMCRSDIAAFYPTLGYTGFVVSVGASQVELKGCFASERWLLSTAVAVPTSVILYVESQLAALEFMPSDGELSVPTFQPIPKSLGDTPVVGPDTPPKYSPATDDDGYFESHQTENNCYDYSTDIATNTFAQPGRGSGHKWTENTCSNMNSSAILDGLQWYGTELPEGQPETGHYVALLIWPETNFHWIRKDARGLWSHKPGGTPVRDTDNTGSQITDPSKSDFSPWTQFCGFMVAVPSQLHIN